MRSLAEIRFEINTVRSKWEGPDPSDENAMYPQPLDLPKMTAMLAINEAFNEIRDLLDDLEAQCSSFME